MSILDIFRMRKKKQPSDEQELIKSQLVLLEAAHAIFSTPSGEIVLHHLIEKADLDGESGSLQIEEANYRNGYQDAIKYVLVLANDINTRS